MRTKYTWLILSICLLSLAGCATESTQPTFRIGVITPLEGDDRPAALDIFFASRAVMLDALQPDRLNGFRLELIAIDDLSHLGQTAQQAEALALDPSLLVIIGHVSPDATQAAIPVYQANGVPLITYSLDAPIDGVFVLDASPARYAELSSAHPAVTIVTNMLHAQDVDDPTAFASMITNSDPSATKPGLYSPLAYDALSLAIAAVQQASDSGNLDREGISEALQLITYSGITGDISFDATGYRVDAPLYQYAINEEGDPILLDRLQ